ncbi:MAG: hypothetical protein H7A51_13375 [Akkermansiaceae bacterium]|nr:hypothetical protein [Akkermansiaceae bacterium]
MKTTLIISLLVALSSSLFSQALSLDKVMSKEDQKKCGINMLTKEEKANLEIWLTKFTLRAMQAAKKPIAQPAKRVVGLYRGGAKGHWIQKKIDNGSMIQLEDGSIWEVSPMSKIDTALWLAIDNVIIASSKNPLYPYLIINSGDGTKAEAKLISQ